MAVTAALGALARAAQRLPKQARVLAVTGAVGALGVVLALPFVRDGAGPAGGPTIPWWLITILFGAAEIFVLHLQVRREAQTISLSEIPLTIGLFFCSPVGFLVGRVVGPFLVFVLHRRQAPVKVLYNTVLVFAEGAIALTIFRAVAGSNPEPGPAGWAASYLAATIAGGLFVGLATTSVISLYEGRLMTRTFLAATAYATPLAMLVATFGLIGVHALRSDPSTAWMLALAGAVLFGGYRAYARLSERHLALERLYRFSQVVTSTADVEDILKDVLMQAKELVRAEEAELVLFPSGEGADGGRLRLCADDRLSHFRADEEPAADWLWQAVFGQGATVLLTRGSRSEAVLEYLRQRGLREAIVAPLPGEEEVLGALVVSNRLGDVRTFDASDAQLLETVANQASVALLKGQLIDKLRHEALHDALTGLPNRVFLQHRIRDALGRRAAERTGGVAVMIMDLDGFKEVNDTLGHQHGDLLLREIAGRLRAIAGPDVVVGRLGGDEFGVVVDCADAPEEARQVSRRLLVALQRPFNLDGFEIEMSGSVGVALAPEHATTVGGLLKNADVAMYRAKGSGERIEVYDPAWDAGDPQRLTLVAELRQAIDRDQLRLFVQPKISLSTGEVEGVEALVRWEHASQGLLLPGEFIPIAERTSLVRSLTAWVLGEALAAAGTWKDGGIDVALAVNLSPRSLTDRALADDLIALLRRSALPPSAVTFEITESGVLTDPPRAIALLERITQSGIRLSIDDFGTGYSSLAYLKRLPVDEVKIDRSFVAALLTDPDSAAIVRAIADLGRGLGLTVVAEGVEDGALLDLLAEFGCHSAQGFYFARPMPVEDFEGWLQGFERRRLAAGGNTTAALRRIA